MKNANLHFGPFLGLLGIILSKVREISPLGRAGIMSAPKPEPAHAGRYGYQASVGNRTVLISVPGLVFRLLWRWPAGVVRFSAVPAWVPRRKQVGRWF